MVWLIVLAGAGIVSIALLWVGLRGRRTDDHPWCHRCRYDLVGAGPGLAVCAECGADLARKRAVRRGHRRKRPAVAALGTILLAGTLSAGGWLGWRTTRGFDWNTIKPVWWLKRESVSANATLAEAAHKELLRRVTDGGLSDTQETAVVELALAVQSDVGATWSETWGDLIETLWDGDRLTDDQVARYVRYAFEPSFTVTPRTRIRAGADLPVQFRGGPYRLSSRHGYFRPEAPQLLVVTRLTGVEAGGKVLEHRPFPSFIHMTLSSGWSTTPTFGLGLPPGTHDVRFTFECGAFWQDRGKPVRSYPSLDERPNLLGRWQIETTVQVEVVPADSEVVEREADATLAEEIKSAVRIELVEKQLTIGRTQYGTRNGMVLFDILPVDVAFDVFCRVGEAEHRIGGISALGGETRLQNTQLDTHPGTFFPGADAVDVIFRASTAPAERTLDITTIWDGELVFEGVPIRSSTG